MKSTQAEHWRPIKGYEGHYEVSDQGRVRSTDAIFIRKNGTQFTRRGMVLKPSRAKAGYLTVNMRLFGERSIHTIHRLVATAFIGEIPEGMDVCHNNGIRDDNRLENLRIDTRAGNMKDRIAHGTAYAKVCRKGLHPMEEGNITINGGRRYCTECLKAARAREYAKRRAKRAAKAAQH